MANKAQPASSFWNMVLDFRKYKSEKTLLAVVERMLERASDDDLEEVNIQSAYEHRLAELKTHRYYDPGKVPGSAWKLILQQD